MNLSTVFLLVGPSFFDKFSKMREIAKKKRYFFPLSDQEVSKNCYYFCQRNQNRTNWKKIDWRSTLIKICWPMLCLIFCVSILMLVSISVFFLITYFAFKKIEPLFSLWCGVWSKIAYPSSWKSYIFTHWRIIYYFMTHTTKVFRSKNVAVKYMFVKENEILMPFLLSHC